MEITYVQSLNKALFELFETDKTVYLIGEDILDPYGGAFKVSKGLSTKFTDRVIATPISEACIVGIGAGMAIRGLRPIIEIMFGDFITLGADQIINHMAKFRQMYNNQVKVPVVIRTPMGGGRGYGPTHSQSLEKIFLGIPGLRVIAPSHFHDPGEILKYIIQKEEEPVIFIEHKLLYPMKIITNMDNELSVEYILNKHKYPIAIVKNYKENRNPDVIIISYGGISYLLEPLLRDLYKDEIYIIAFLLSEISDFSVEFLFEFIINCGKIIIIEEGTGYFGWSTEISAQIYEKYSQYLAKPIKRLTSFNSIIPAAKHLENKVLPNRETLERLIEEMIV
jgi:pyruvate/2-oxoglutarate/acetoin dehydrogenase E1 component